MVHRRRCERCAANWAGELSRSRAGCQNATPHDVFPFGAPLIEKGLWTISHARTFGGQRLTSNKPACSRATLPYFRTLHGLPDCRQSGTPLRPNALPSRSLPRWCRRGLLCRNDRYARRPSLWSERCVPPPRRSVHGFPPRVSHAINCGTCMLLDLARFAQREKSLKTKT